MNAQRFEILPSYVVSWNCSLVFQNTSPSSGVSSGRQTSIVFVGKQLLTRLSAENITVSDKQDCSLDFLLLLASFCLMSSVAIMSWNEQMRYLFCAWRSWAENNIAFFRCGIGWLQMQSRSLRKLVLHLILYSASRRCFFPYASHLSRWTISPMDDFVHSCWKPLVQSEVGKRISLSAGAAYNHVSSTATAVCALGFISHKKAKWKRASHSKIYDRCNLIWSSSSLSLSMPRRH